MGGIFKLDSPLMNFLNRVADLLILNVVTLVCCFPVITIGASVTAMWSVLLKIVRKEEPSIVKAFWSSFKENLKQSTVLWLIMLVFGGILAADYYFFTADTQATMFSASLRYAILAVTIIVLIVSMYIFPIQSRFRNKVLATIRNAFFLSISQLPKTIAIAAVYVIAALLYAALLGILFPVLLMLGITVPCYVNAIIFNSIFKKFEPKVEEVVTDEYKPLSIFDEDASAVSEAAQDGDLAQEAESTQNEDSAQEADAEVAKEE